MKIFKIVLFSVAEEQSFNLLLRSIDVLGVDPDIGERSRRCFRKKLNSICNWCHYKCPISVYAVHEKIV